MINIRMINEGGTFELTSLKTVINRRLIIPSYQRAYAWDGNNIEDLFNTIREGFSQESEPSNVSNKNQPIFFGSVIFSQKSDDTYLIIDGQQRVTTFLFILRMIQEKIKQKKDSIEKHLSRLDQELTKHLDKGDKASINKTNNFIRESEKKLDDFDQLIKKVNNILEITHISRESITDQDSMESEYLNYITRKSYNKTKDFEQNKNEIIKHIESLIEDLIFPSIYDKYSYIIDYILNKVKFCILSINGENAEEYAVDVFNTLNSTGEPLTGFEVLKSTLIQMSKSPDKKKEVENKLFNLENEIKKYKPTRKDRNKQKGKLLLYLAVHRNDYDKGKLSDKNFKDQNEYIKKILKQSSSKQNDEQEQRALQVLDDMERLNKFVTSNWLPKNSVNRGYTKALSSEKDILALKGLDFLIDIGHDRVIPSIYKYSESYLDNHFDLINYKKIIEYCTSFSCLWRMAFHGGAAGIDAEYLKISKSLNNDIDIEQARVIILDRMKRKFPQKTDWMENFLQSEINKNKKLSQFLLALISLKDLSSYHSKEWKLVLLKSNSNTKHLLGNSILLHKDVYNKYVKNNSKLDLKKHLEQNIYNIDVIDCYFNEDVQERTKKFGKLIWNKLAEDVLGYK